MRSNVDYYSSGHPGKHVPVEQEVLPELGRVTEGLERSLRARLDGCPTARPGDMAQGTTKRRNPRHELNRNPECQRDLSLMR